MADLHTMHVVIYSAFNSYIIMNIHYICNHQIACCMLVTMTTVQLLLCGHACQLRSIFVNFHLRLQPIMIGSGVTISKSVKKNFFHIVMKFGHFKDLTLNLEVPQ